MSFSFVSAAWVLAGLGAIAAGLFALQRLRVRHRDVTVVTTLFWAEAVREARARTLVDRFRHPLAYLLVLAVASLLWIGAAGPERSAGGATRRVLLLDASARMGRSGRFAAAVASLNEDVALLPRDRTSVVLCGRTPRTLLLPGENALLLDERLKSVAAEAAPESVTATLHEILVTNEGPLEIRLHGDAPLPSARALPAGVEVVRAGPGPLPAAPNAGVTALGITDARSGAWTAVDVFVEVRGSPLPDVAGIRVAWNAVDPLPDPVVEQGAGRNAGSVVIRYRDLPANGAVFDVSLPGGDALAQDDQASVTLPLRTRIRVTLPDEAPPALRAALVGDPRVLLVDREGPADVRVTRTAEDAGTVPTLVLGNAAGDSFRIGDPDLAEADTATADEAARRLVGVLALDRIDATGLATEAARPITAGAGFSAVRSVTVAEELLTPRFDFVQDDAFPVFVARSVRWLAGAGDDAPRASGLLSPAETLAAAAGSTASAAPYGGTPLDLALLAGLAATALLVTEWVLYRGGRIP